MYNSFLSPIHQYTDLAFRMLCQKYGAEATCVPLINSTGIVKNTSMIDAHPKEKNIGLQLVGKEPGEIGKASNIVDESFPFIKWYNINCGCPATRTVNYGGGSAMLESPDKIIKSVIEVKKLVDKPVSVKIRIKENLQQTIKLCKDLENAGVDFIIIHGRTVKQGYSGKTDWELIKKLKQKLEIPLVGNGDIKTAAEGRRFVEKGYCDSFMVARAAMANPMIFADKKAETPEQKFRLFEEYLKICKEYVGEPELKDAKIKASNFMIGIRNASAIRNRISNVRSIDDILTIRDSYE